MSREIQLSTNSPAAADFWTQGGAAALAPGVAPPQSSAPAPVARSPLNKMHRLLRGRYPLAIVLAAGFAAAGAVGGYSSIPPKFESTATVQINPLVESGGANPGMLPQAGQFFMVQMGLISSPTVAEKAIQMPSFKCAWYEAFAHQPLPTGAKSDVVQGETFKNVWQQVYPHQPLPASGDSSAIQDEKFKVAWYEAFPHQPLPTTAEMVASEDPGHAKGDGLIHLSFSDRNKAVAQAGARAIVSTYMAMYGNFADGYTGGPQTLLLNENKRAAIDNDIGILNSQLDKFVAKNGMLDVGPELDLKARQLDVRETDWNNALMAYNEALEASKGKTPQPTDKESIYLQIASSPERNLMPKYLGDRDAARTNMAEVGRKWGENHPAYRDAKAQLIAAENRVDEFAIQFQKANPGFISPSDGSASNLESLKNRVDLLKKQVDDTRTQVADLAAQRAAVEKIKGQIAELTGRREGIERTIETINNQQALTKTVTVIDPGSEATIDDKKRKLAAGVGMLFGGMLPFGLLMLYGLGENRFRYSDDANATDLSGVTLLGILPNLPDRLSDPQQAGVAAHCVHQIRTMLQISRSNDEPQVIAVTSAAPGDGKTSLTLALGLSYAACGARTLLVDCDLVAAGLTHRLNVSSPDGVLEAVANRALLEYVRTTDIADVAILPVGTTHAHHASTLSPVALRRLLSEAKKQFDIIIVDTGPILGSIEASLVCAASDRTILTVARNQQRPLVERSIGHLQSIGSNLAGVVFNRAQARDFEKSMSGLALRSRPPAPSGTTAKAVAGSFKRAG